MSVSKGTIVGTGVAAIVVYAGKQELATPPLHWVHTLVLSAFLLLAIALILNDDARVLAFMKGLGEIATPWRKPPLP